MQIIRNSLFALSVFFFGSVLAQDRVLSKQEAVVKTLDNNYGIKISRNNIEIAENNSSILNSGYLPSLTGVGGMNYNLEDINAELQGGEIREVEAAETNRYNASLNLNYTLFDGLGRWYNFKQLKEQYNLSTLEARETIENTILQMLVVYFEIARFTSKRICCLRYSSFSRLTFAFFTLVMVEPPSNKFQLKLAPAAYPSVVLFLAKEVVGSIAVFHP